MLSSECRPLLLGHVLLPAAPQIGQAMQTGACLASHAGLSSSGMYCFLQPQTASSADASLCSQPCKQPAAAKPCKKQSAASNPCKQPAALGSGQEWPFKAACSRLQAVKTQQRESRGAHDVPDLLLHLAAHPEVVDRVAQAQRDQPRPCHCCQDCGPADALHVCRPCEDVAQTQACQQLILQGIQACSEPGQMLHSAELPDLRASQRSSRLLPVRKCLPVPGLPAARSAGHTGRPHTGSAFQAGCRQGLALCRTARQQVS